MLTYHASFTPNRGNAFRQELHKTDASGLYSRPFFLPSSCKATLLFTISGSCDQLRWNRKPNQKEKDCPPARQRHFLNSCFYGLPTEYELLSVCKDAWGGETTKSFVANPGSIITSTQWSVGYIPSILRTGSISLLTSMIASTSDVEVHSGSDSDSSLPSLQTLTTTPRKSKTTPSKPANRVQEEEQDTTNDDDGDDLPARPLRSAGAHHIVISSDDESDGDITPLSSPKRRTAYTSTPTSSSRKPVVATPPKQKQPYPSPRRTRSSGLPILPPSTNGFTRRSTRLQTRKSITEPREDESTTVPEGSSPNLPDSENESDVVTPTRSGRRGKHPRRQTLDLGESETSGDAERSPTKKTRLIRPVEKSIPLRKLNKQDEEDLEDDLEILQDTGTVIRFCGLRVSYTDFQVQRCVISVLEAGQLLQRNKPPRNNWIF